MRKDYNLEKRKYIIGGFIVVLVIIYIIRLLNLQIVDSRYKDDADSNAFLRKAVYPSRGTIYDRNGKVVVFNRPAYDVMIIPRDVHPFDTLDFCNTLGISEDQLRRRFHDMKDRRKNPGYSKYSPQTLLTQLTAEDYVAFRKSSIAFRDSTSRSVFCANTTTTAPPMCWETYAKYHRKTSRKTRTIRAATTPATSAWREATKNIFADKKARKFLFAMPADR